MKTIILVLMSISQFAFASTPCSFSTGSNKNQIVCGDNRLAVFAQENAKVQKVVLLVSDLKLGTEKTINVSTSGLTLASLKKDSYKAKAIQKQINENTKNKEISVVSFELETTEKYYSDAKLKNNVSSSQFVIQRNVASTPVKAGGVRGE